MDYLLDARGQVGKYKTIETLINEEVLLLAKFMRWKKNMVSKTNKNRIMDRLKITTESLANFLPWIASVLTMILFFVFFFILGRFYALTLADEINFFLSSVIAVFALVEGLSTYLQVRLEKDRRKLQEIRD